MELTLSKALKRGVEVRGVPIATSSDDEVWQIYERSVVRHTPILESNKHMYPDQAQEYFQTHSKKFRCDLGLELLSSYGSLLLQTIAILKNNTNMKNVAFHAPCFPHLYFV